VNGIKELKKGDERTVLKCRRVGKGTSNAFSMDT
jgi:hypothetical protein